MLSGSLVRPIAEPIFWVVSLTKTTGLQIQRFSPSWTVFGVHIPLADSHPTTMLKYLDLILSSCLRAVAPLMPFPRIGGGRIIGFVHLYPWLWMWSNMLVRAARPVHSSLQNGLPPTFGICWSLVLPDLPLLSKTLFLCLRDLIWLSLVHVRRCFIVASRLFFSVAQNSQCWLYA